MWQTHSKSSTIFTFSLGGRYVRAVLVGFSVGIQCHVFLFPPLRTQRMCLVLWRFLLILNHWRCFISFGVSSGFGWVSFSCFCCRSVSGCVWVCVGVHAGCVCPVRDAPLYIPVQTGVGVWFSRLSPDECIFCLWFPNKSVAVPFFSPDVEWSLPPSLSLPALSPASLPLWSLIQMCLAQL